MSALQCQSFVSCWSRKLFWKLFSALMLRNFDCSGVWRFFCSPVLWISSYAVNIAKPARRNRECTGICLLLAIYQGVHLWRYYCKLFFSQLLSTFIHSFLSFCFSEVWGNSEKHRKSLQSPQDRCCKVAFSHMVFPACWLEFIKLLIEHYWEDCCITMVQLL